LTIFRCHVANLLLYARVGDMRNDARTVFRLSPLQLDTRVAEAVTETLVSVARMSEAICEVAVPHIASLMRATLLVKKPKPETREAAMHVRVKPSVKTAAERLAQQDGRSLANWLARLIEAEAARRDGKK
jgi:hypothetical protein